MCTGWLIRCATSRPLTPTCSLPKVIDKVGLCATAVSQYHSTNTYFERQHAMYVSQRHIISGWGRVSSSPKSPIPCTKSTMCAITFLWKLEGINYFVHDHLAFVLRRAQLRRKHTRRPPVLCTITFKVSRSFPSFGM